MTGRANRGAALRATLTDLLADTGPSTRAHLAALSGAPTSTVVDAVRAMLAAGEVEEVAGERAGRAGRPSGLVRLTSPGVRTGVVVFGRDVMRVAGVDGRGRVSAQAHGSFDPQDPAGPFAQAASLLTDVAEQAGSRDDVRCVVVGVPFPVHDGRRSWPRRSRSTRNRWGEARPPWVHVDLRAAFPAAPGVPVVVENDANLVALGEARAGAGVGVDNMISLTVARGLGAGVVINQQLVRGAVGFAGELAHTQLDPRGALCSCGSRGCMVTQTEWDQVIELMRPAFREDVTLDDVVALAADGHTGVHRMLVDHGQLIGEVLAYACVLLNPEVICVDARLGAAAQPVIEGITYTLARRAPGAAADSVRVVPGQLDGTADYVGAAALAQQHLRQSQRF